MRGLRDVCSVVVVVVGDVLEVVVLQCHQEVDQRATGDPEIVKYITVLKYSIFSPCTLSPHRQNS